MTPNKRVMLKLFKYHKTMKNIKGVGISDTDFNMLREMFMNTDTEEEFEDWARERVYEMRNNDTTEEYTSNKGKIVKHRYDEDVRMPDSGVESAESSISRIKRYPARRKIMLKEKFKKISANT